VARAPAPSPDEGGQPQDVAAIAAEFFWTDAGLATLQAWLAEYWMARAWLDDDTPDAAPQDNADAATSTGPRAAATDSASEMPPPADHPTDAGPAAQPSAGTDPAATATKPSSTTASARITPPLMRPYVVQRGDTLTRIAERMLGDAARWEEIYNLNRDQIHDPDTIREGMVLWILPRNSPTDD
jgi:nucleoid-associated protein YgaU